MATTSLSGLGLAVEEKDSRMGTALNTIAPRALEAATNVLRQTGCAPQLMEAKHANVRWRAWFVVVQTVDHALSAGHSFRHELFRSSDSIPAPKRAVRYDSKLAELCVGWCCRSSCDSQLTQVMSHHKQPWRVRQ